MVHGCMGVDGRCGGFFSISFSNELQHDKCFIHTVNSQPSLQVNITVWWHNISHWLHNNTLSIKPVSRCMKRRVRLGRFRSGRLQNNWLRFSFRVGVVISATPKSVLLLFSVASGETHLSRMDLYVFRFSAVVYCAWLFQL